MLVFVAFLLHGSFCLRCLRIAAAAFNMDALGIEPRASRMLGWCDTTTPCALLMSFGCLPAPLRLPLRIACGAARLPAHALRRCQLWGSNPRPCELAPEASGKDHSAKQALRPFPNQCLSILSQWGGHVAGPRKHPQRARERERASEEMTAAGFEPRPF